MKSCTVCDTDYRDQHTTFPTDGAVLIVSHELVRGKYRNVRKPGQGGMGVLYLADDILLGVLVALKLLVGDPGKDPKFIKRLRMEARGARQLGPPNIVEVTDLDQAEDASLFITVEFLVGPSLRAILAQAGALDLPRALEIARQLPGATERPKPPQAEKSKPKVETPQFPPQPKRVPEENSKLSVSKAKVAEQLKTAPAESPKRPVPSLGAAEAEQQVETFDRQQRFTEAAPLYDQACAGGIAAACRHLGRVYGAGLGFAQDLSRAITLTPRLVTGAISSVA